MLLLTYGQNKKFFCRHWKLDF